MLRRSSFVHQLPLGGERVLLLHAISQVRLTVDRDVAAVLDWFAITRAWPDDADGLSAFSHDRAALLGCVDSLRERGLLTDVSAEAELADIQAKLGATYGRDPL